MIEAYSFGRIKIKGKLYTRDIQINSQGSVLPDWQRQKGHIVYKEDVLNILDSNTTLLILGKGEPGMMKASQALKQYLRQNQIELVEKPSSQAAELVNQFVKEKRPFAAGFHLTC
ncbi:MAG: MTH938/NDUFAF3 family protein [Desulfobacteraceae bacterium]